MEVVTSNFEEIFQGLLCAIMEVVTNFNISERQVNLTRRLVPNKISIGTCVYAIYM